MNRVAALLALLAGCAPHVERITAPQRVEPFCGQRAVKTTALESIVSSIADDVSPGAHPKAKIAKALRDAGGTFAYWDRLHVPLPQSAKRFGMDGMLEIRGIAVDNRKVEASNRTIFLLLRSRGREEWHAAHAFDTQDVCVEGRRES